MNCGHCSGMMTLDRLDGRRLASNVFAGLDAKKPLQFGRTLSRGRRGGR